MQKAHPSITLINFDRNNPAHKTALREINLPWIEKYFTIEPFDLEILDNPASILNNEGFIILAQTDTDIAGSICLQKKDNGIFEVSKFGVKEGFQGYGIGKILLNKLIDVAKSRKLPEIYLFTNTKLVAANNLYTSVGFKDVEGYEHGYQRCDRTMKLSLQ